MTKVGNRALGGTGFSPARCNRLEACSTISWLAGASPISSIKSHENKASTTERLLFQTSLVLESCSRNNKGTICSQTVCTGGTHHGKRFHYLFRNCRRWRLVQPRQWGKVEEKPDKPALPRAARGNPDSGFGRLPA